MGKKYSRIQADLGFRTELIYDPLRAAEPDFLDIVSKHCLQNRPGNILECSSGLTTLILARCCQLNNYGHVFSLENDYRHRAETIEILNQHHLQDYATVLHAPLVDTRIGKESYRWYLVESLPVNNIEMLVIDGPPGYIQKNSRFPAIPVLADRLANGVVIFLDDADREDERMIVDRWKSETGLSLSELSTKRGCARLSTTN